MARRKARAARRAAAALHTNSDGAADISIPDAPTATTSNKTDLTTSLPPTAPQPMASEPPPPGGQAQAKQEAQAQATINSKKRKSSDAQSAPTLETTIINGITYKIQPEGQAKILLPPVEGGNTTEVFYNYIQKFNRDLTMTVTRGFGEIVESERKTPRRQHRGGVKHKKRQQVVDTNLEGGVGEQVNGVEQEDIDMAEPAPQADETIPPPQPQQPPPDNDNKEKQRFAVLDALSATGLRALRYAKELPFVTHVTANDMSPTAVEYIYRNVQFNNLTHIITPNHDNATGHMYRTAFPNYIPSPTPENPFKMRLVAPQKYHVIDLDPYGSATQFIDSAVQALEDGGLLSVTCTDAAIFASTSYPEKTFATYGGLPAKGDFSHETGLRMVLMSIATTAAKYGLYIEPLLSLSIDYYCRVFVRVRKSAENVKKLSSKGMVLLNCGAGCGAWKAQELGTLRVRQQYKRKNKQHNTNDIPSYKYGVSQAVENGRCDHCGFKMHLAGPMWSDEIHNAGFINHLLSNVLGQETVKEYETLGRVSGMLKLALGELMPPSPREDEAPTSEIHPAAAEPTPADGQPVVAVINAEGGGKPNLQPSLKRKLKQREEAAEKEEEDGAEGEVSKTSGSSYPKTRNPTADPLALFIMPTQLARVLHCTAPSVSAFRGALLGLGYHVTKSHCRAGSLKTNAPWDQIWRVMRAWEKLNPVKEGSVTPGMAGYKILYPAVTGGEEEEEEEDFGDVMFDEVLGKDRGKGKGDVLYQQNPGAYWGPMAKASKKGLTAEESSKLGNAEKDKRRREERARRQLEREKEGGGVWEEQKAKRNKSGLEDVVEEGEKEDVARPPKGGSRESDGAQYGLAPISASEMEMLEAEMKA
ncbi:RNA methyltransferase tRNA(m5U54)methyltransferase [Orbilia oligospora]|uniref:tRNA (guanine(26)-N(2))-dimethyltransferase n=1 Tax=Orbilia oligospora TaxID=2813651 RepID=A0A8H2HRR8_ORBOL|nr:RNA methyltransferase tRNA(m5U54)methyltransferase [Orbilia oligospora]